MSHPVQHSHQVARVSNSNINLSTKGEGINGSYNYSVTKSKTSGNVYIHNKIKSIEHALVQRIPITDLNK